MGAIGTSQEGAHTDVVPQLALNAKEIGIDAHRIGDAFLPGTGDPELLYAYSVAVRGRRHTWEPDGAERSRQPQVLSPCLCRYRFLGRV
ncbi:DUF7916 family protein [Streptomyces sp. NBC_01335]|uniref:DUF7916 family protein n=1 Tax=Streptomyces sp. NBC_01335 TaxID=2903828 RepID=UPI003FA39F34